MKNRSRFTISAVFVCMLAAPSFAAPVIGQPAPTFTATDSQGKTQRLADQKGKFVVLQWLNFGCPFIKQHYDSGNMQKLQQMYTDRGVVWYAILSSAPGKEGYATPSELTTQLKEHNDHSTAVLMDPKGNLGHLYEAKTTPHMFIIDPKGVLIYKGAIDSTPSTDPADIPKSTNYISKALDEALAGKPVTTSATQPYGCSVKY